MPSASLTLRNVKGSALTFTEMDNNLTSLATAANASASLSGSSFTGNVEFNNNHISNAILQTTIEKTVSLGSVSGAVTINANSGPIQRATLTGNITINTTNLTNFTTGESVTLVLTQDATGSRILTSNLKYAGASKTLTTTANAIDTIAITYDGTNYLAALVKGYA